MVFLSAAGESSTAMLLTCSGDFFLTVLTISTLREGSLARRMLLQLPSFRPSQVSSLFLTHSLPSVWERVLVVQHFAESHTRILTSSEVPTGPTCTANLRSCRVGRTGGLAGLRAGLLGRAPLPERIPAPVSRVQKFDFVCCTFLVDVENFEKC